MASISKNNSELSCQNLFLSESLVKFVIRICKSFQISKYDQFSILDTLQFALFNHYKQSVNQQVLDDEQKMCIIILNIIKLTEKFNKASSSFVKNADAIFKELGINKNVYNISEFESYSKLMGFQIKNPVVLEDIYRLIEKNFDTNELKNSIFDYSKDVLILLYYWKNQILNEFLKTMNHQDSWKIITNQKLQALSVFFVVLKILNISKYNEIFEKVCSNLKDEVTSSEVNQLCAVLFGLIKNKAE